MKGLVKWILTGLVACLPGLASAQPTQGEPGSPPVAKVVRFGAAYEVSWMSTTWTVTQSERSETLSTDVLSPSPAFHTLRLWVGRRKAWSPNVAGEVRVSLGVGHAFERRQSLVGTLGTPYRLESSFNLLDLELGNRLLFLRQIVFVELGFCWQRLVASARLRDGADDHPMGRSEDYLGGHAGLGAELEVVQGLHVGLSLGAAGYIKGFGPFPTRKRISLFVSW